MTYCSKQKTHCSKEQKTYCSKQKTHCSKEQMTYCSKQKTYCSKGQNLRIVMKKKLVRVQSDIINATDF